MTWVWGILTLMGAISLFLLGREKLRIPTGVLVVLLITGWLAAFMFLASFGDGRFAVIAFLALLVWGAWHEFKTEYVRREDIEKDYLRKEDVEEHYVRREDIE